MAQHIKTEDHFVSPNKGIRERYEHCVYCKVFVQNENKISHKYTKKLYLNGKTCVG